MPAEGLVSETDRMCCRLPSLLTGNGLDGDLGVLGSTTDQRDGDLLAGVLGLGLPGDLEGLASGDLLPVGGSENGVEVGDLGEGLGSEGQQGSGGDGELHLEGWI